MPMSSPSKPMKIGLPILEGILPFRASQLPLDALAGVTLAALAIPEVLGYSKIAGMPVITGLYTMLIPMVLYALFGASRHLVVGADSATAAILAAGLAGMAAAGSPEYVALAGVLALLAALLLLVARLIRLGFLADFLSLTVLIGFLTGVGVHVAVGQIAGMLGIPGGGSGPIQQLLVDLRQLPDANPVTMAIAAAVVIIIVGGRRINPKFPGPLLAVIGSIVVSRVVNLAALHVAVLGPVPSGLPTLSLPQANLSWSVLEQLLPTAFSMFVVILAQSAATSRAYAARYGEHSDENVDLVGLSLANIGAGLSGAYVVNGSPTKTQMVDSAGGRSQVAQLTTVAVVVVVLLFLTGPLAYLPEAVLAAVVFLIGLELIDLKGMAAVLAQRPAEFLVALITALVVIFAGVEQGIILAMIFSLVVHTRHGYMPRNMVVTQRSGQWLEVPVASPAQAAPGLVVYRFAHSMYYANAEQMAQEVMDLIKLGPDPVSELCINLSSVDDVDYTSAASLVGLAKELSGRGVRLTFVHANDHVRRELDRSGITALVGADAYYVHVRDVVDAQVQRLDSNQEADPPPMPCAQAGSPDDAG